MFIKNKGHIGQFGLLGDTRGVISKASLLNKQGEISKWF